MAQPLVLIVEDDPLDAGLIRRSIEAAQFATRVCTDVPGALLMLATGPVDAMVIDYRLGAMTGIEAFGAVRAAGYRTPVLLMTGVGREDFVVDAFHAGVADYLLKASITAESIKRALTNAIDQHALQTSLDERTRSLEQVNRELQDRNLEIERFYHTLCHELKTPLTSAREFVAIVMDGLAGPVLEQQRDYLRIAKDSCDLLTVYINDLIDVTRIETGKMTLHVQAGDLRALVERTVALTLPRTQAADIAFTTRISGDLPPIVFDGSRIQQVLSNLFDNALKFTARGGRVEVGAEVAAGGDEVRVWVEDTGKGIAPEHHDRIFDRLFQVRSTEAGSAEGLGIGLSVCRDLVLLHGGRIWIESSLGAGSKFLFTLPLETVPA